MVWRPIGSYSVLRKKALFADDEGFIFIGEGTSFRGKLEFWDYLDFYEPKWWMELPLHPNDEAERRRENEAFVGRTRGKSLNRFDPIKFDKVKNDRADE